MKWIKLNLPFYVDYYNVFEGPPEPLLLKKAKSFFGKDFKKQPSEKIKQYYLNCEAEILCREGAYIDLKEELKKLKDPKVNAVLEYQAFNKKYFNWLEEQPEYIAWSKEYSKCEKEYIKIKKQESFCGRGLNKPGTLIEIFGGDQFLLGDVNCSGGVCDDCMIFNNDSIITRYMVVWKGK